MTEASVARVLRAASFPEKENSLPATAGLFCGVYHILREVWEGALPSAGSRKMDLL